MYLPVPRLVTASLLSAIILSSATVAYAGRKQRREAQVAESAKPRSAPGGVTFEVSLGYDAAYDGALNYLKRQGHTLESAGRDTGQLITAMVVKGIYRQTGTRLQVTLIKESAEKTTVRVAVVQHKRSKALQTEPWNEPKVNDTESERVADELKQALRANGPGN